MGATLSKHSLCAMGNCKAFRLLYGEGKLTARCKLYLIVSYYIRKSKVDQMVPMQIKQFIIETFIYQPIFETGRQPASSPQWMSHHINSLYTRKFQIFQIIVVGDQQAKTSLIKNYFAAEWRPGLTIPTPWITSTSSVADIPLFHHYTDVVSNGKKIGFSIWDVKLHAPIYGETLLHTLMRITPFDGALICYDISNKRTLSESVKKWNDELNKGPSDSMIKYLVGCECEETDKRGCQQKEAVKIAQDLGIDDVIDTSAICNINVAKLFDGIVGRMFEERWSKANCPFYG